MPLAQQQGMVDSQEAKGPAMCPSHAVYSSWTADQIESCSMWEHARRGAQRERGRGQLKTTEHEDLHWP